jgi:signal transduction histidine kinase
LNAGKGGVRHALARTFGVRARLLFAFFGISAFAVLAAAAGIYAFREVGQRLDLVDTRVPPTLASLELSRSAERIIAAAPAFLAVTDRQRRDEVKAQLETEVGRLTAKLADLKRDQTDAQRPLKIDAIVSSLTINLSALDDVVSRRLNANDQVRMLLRGAFQTNDETQRLLAPWLMVTDSQISRLLAGIRQADPTSPESGLGSALDLASLLDVQRPAQSVDRLFSTAIGMLAEASASDQDRRLTVLTFQLGRSLRELEATASGLDTKLKPLFLEQVSKLREFVEGPNSIPEARKREINLVSEGQRRLAENAALSSQLATAVDDLASAAKLDIGDATRDALAVQRVSTRILVAAVALSLLTSVLIVWLYVGRNIVRRLTKLSHSMLSIAGGQLDAHVLTQGTDEIAAMGKAVEVFRGNAIELERLLEERKEAAERLEQLVEERTRELERRSSALRVTFDNMGHGVVMFDRDRRMVAWNHRFEELLDLPDDKVGADVKFEDFIRYLAERGEFGACDIEEEVERRLTSLDRSYVGERTRPTGTVLEVRRNPVASGGFVSIYADVTEKRKAQALVELARARLTDAIESISDGFALWDLEDRLVICNSRCQELLESADLFVPGTPFGDLLRSFGYTGRYDLSHSDNLSAWIEERLAMHRNPPSTCDVRLANGRWLRTSEFRTREGGTVTIWADITAAKQRERDLEQARDAAAEASRTMEEAYRELKAAQASLVHAEKMASLGQLTAGIAHEIKNPLNFVNNFASLSEELLGELKEALAPALAALDAPALADAEDLIATLTGNLSKIAEHGRRADGIVRSMLLHSRSGSGERQHTNVNALVEEALNLAYHGARAQDQNFNVALERDLDPDLGPVELIPQDVTRVFINLFGNGFYATAKRRHSDDPGYRPVLRVATRGIGDQIEISVRDNGVGIPSDVRSKLFTPFFTTKPTGEGTGLGLSISYDIVVREHGGTITVDSCPGVFTEFVIRLPRTAARAGKPATVVEAEP